MRRLLMILSVVMFFFLPNSALSQTNDEEKVIDDTVKTILTEKRNTLKNIINLDGGEEIEFWEIYDKFEEEMTQVMNEILPLAYRLNFDYKSLTETQVEQLIDHIVEYQKEAIEIQGKYMKKFSKMLSQEQMAILLRDLYIQ